MVTILSVAFTPPTGRTQERTSAPLMCTEQAPHCATPQPYLVPVRPTCSRMTQSSGVSASTCTSRTRPLMLSFAMGPPGAILADSAARGGGCARLELERLCTAHVKDYARKVMVEGKGFVARDLKFLENLRDADRSKVGFHSTTCPTL